MAETAPHLSRRPLELIKKTKKKVFNQCGKTFVCISNGPRKPLTERAVVAVLRVKRAAVVADNQRGVYWVRGTDEEYQSLRDRLGKRQLSGDITRVVILGGEDWRRLLGKLAVDGASQLQNAIGNAVASSPTSHPVAAPQNDDAHVGGNSTLPAGGTVVAGDPESGPFGTSPIPGVPWYPSPFTTPVELGLTNGIRLRYDELGTFLRGSSNLQVLRLVNVRLVGGNIQLVEGNVQLPHLTELILAELIEPVGLSGLFLFIDAPECQRLHLDLHPSEAFITHPLLPLRAAPAVQKIPFVGQGIRVVPRVPQHQEHPVRVVDFGRRSWVLKRRTTTLIQHPLPPYQQRIGRCLLQVFSRVRVIVKEAGKIVVEVDDSLSGAIAAHPGLGLEAIMHRSEPLPRIKANVVNRYLRRLGRMMAPRQLETWFFNALETVRLRAIPKKRRGAMPHASGRCSLEQFVSCIRKQRFGIEIDTGELLGEADRLWGIEINHLDGWLAYGEAEGEEEEEDK
ncbi:hypothetical protein FRC00_000914 [Tulasnella sp. 408]|nr:hypothetical protein FRC00_000914 [Tulasnella sp. 408]